MQSDSNSNSNTNSNTEIRLQPSWLGKINWGLGCQINFNNPSDKHIQDKYMFNDPNEKYEPIIYNDRKTTIKNYNNKPYPDEYSSLTYNISRISRHILGYREYHRYYLQPVILQDIQPTEIDKLNSSNDGSNDGNMGKYIRNKVNMNIGVDEPDNCSDNELIEEPDFNDKILSDIDDYLED